MQRSKEYDQLIDSLVLRWKYVNSIEWLAQSGHLIISTDNKEYLIPDADHKIWDSICYVIHGNSAFLRPSLKFDNHENVILTLSGNIHFRYLNKQEEKTLSKR